MRKQIIWVPISSLLTMALDRKAKKKLTSFECRCKKKKKK